MAIATASSVFVSPSNIIRHRRASLNLKTFHTRNVLGFLPTDLQPVKIENLAKTCMKELKADTKGNLTVNMEGEIQLSVAFHQAKNVQDQSCSKPPYISVPLRTNHGYYQIIKYPIVSESAIKEVLYNNTLVFVVDRNAGKKEIKDALKMMFGIRTRKVNTSIRADGSKKAYVMLTADFSASELAKKLRII